MTEVKLDKSTEDRAMTYIGEHAGRHLRMMYDSFARAWVDAAESHSGESVTPATVIQMFIAALNTQSLDNYAKDFMRENELR